MKKQEFLNMMMQDIETETEQNKQLYADVIDCMDIALSQSPDDLEISGDKNLKSAFALIEKRARNKKANCVGPFEAAEILAEYLGAKYTRKSKQIKTRAKINFEDLF